MGVIGTWVYFTVSIVYIFSFSQAHILKLLTIYRHTIMWHAYKLIGIWSWGWHFWVQDIDVNCTTFDSGVSATFDQETIAGSGAFQKYTYYGHISEILTIGYCSFELFIRSIKWYQAVWKEDQYHP